MEASNKVMASRCEITPFILQHSDIIIVSDIEGFMPKAQVKKVMEYAKSEEGAIKSQGKGVIFNGDVLDYTVTFGTESAAKVKIGSNSEEVCSLKLLKALVDGMIKPNPSVICNIGNRDLNKIKLLALLLTSDGQKWWEEGSSYKDIAENLLKNFNESKCKATFWEFSDLKTINPFWNSSNTTAFNPRWNSLKEISTTTLSDRYNYIFGADPGTGTISAPNNIDYMHVELEINTNDIELKAAIVFTMYARMLFMKYDPENQKNLEYDGVLREYLLKSHAASYGVIGDNLLLFGHGGFTTNFFENDSAVEILKKILNEKREEFDSVYDITYKSPPSSQKGGSFIYKLRKIDNFDKDVKLVFDSLFSESGSDKMSEKYIREKEKGRKYLSDELAILNILCTPASNHPIFKEDKFKQYNTELSPIQVSMPVKNSLTEKNTNTPLKTKSFIETTYIHVYNIFSHIPKGFGYSFGSASERSNTYFINTDFSNSCFKDVTLLHDYDTNYLLLHLKIKEYKYVFSLEGNMNMNLYPSVNDEEKDEKIKAQLNSIFKNQGHSTREYMKKLDNSLKIDPSLLKNISYCPDSLEGVIKFEYNYTIYLNNPPKSVYENLLFHGTSKINDKYYNIYSFNSKTFKKMIILLPTPKPESAARTLRAVTNTGQPLPHGGVRKLSKKNRKSNKIIKVNKRLVRSRVQRRRK